MKPSIRKYLAKIGRKGGRSKSDAKRAAVRENGRKRMKVVPPIATDEQLDRIGDGIRANVEECL